MDSQELEQKFIRYHCNVELILQVLPLLPSLYFSLKINYMIFKNSCLLIALALLTSLDAGAQGIN
ncbi:MAG: hypothetical protein ACKOCH_15310, partial [Bacteroidota bacterium]